MRKFTSIELRNGYLLAAVDHVNAFQPLSDLVAKVEDRVWKKIRVDEPSDKKIRLSNG
jgi:hypothetical protein